MDASILAELVQIKWLLVAITMVAVLGAAFRIRMEYRRSGGPHRLLRDHFTTEAYQLLDEAKHQELLELSKSRCTEFPGDATAYWYHALAAHRLGDRTTALASIKRVEELQPDWREGTVLPFIRGMTALDTPVSAYVPTYVTLDPPSGSNKT